MSLSKTIKIFERSIIKSEKLFTLISEVSMKLTSTEPLNKECVTDRVPASSRGLSLTLGSESSVPVHSGSLQLPDLLSQLCHVHCQQVQLSSTIFRDL